MNYIPGPGMPEPLRLQRRADIIARCLATLVAACGLLLTISCSATDTPDESESSDYSLAYRVIPLPAQNQFQVELTLKQSQPSLREMRMRASGDFLSDFTGEGNVSIQDGELVWNPPERGGVLTWLVQANRLKTGDRYDAYMNDTWALFRASDLIPPAETRTAKGATSKTSLSFTLPSSWSSVTQYAGQNDQYQIDNPDRRFDRPTGWMLLGQLGVRTEKIAGIQVKIAAPKNHGVRRMDMLALLSWTLPEANRLFPGLPARLTIISANGPMWRGGLSAPSSLYLHASLPLISENGTSTLMHEVVHIGMRASAADNADWIIEGLAEYYGLQLLLRSGTITEKRYARALTSLRSWSEEAQSLCSKSSRGAITARSTVLMHDLDQEIRTGSDQLHNLDDVMNALSNLDQEISIADFVNEVAAVLPTGSTVLDDAELSLCK
jgi:hypothetical protein